MNKSLSILAISCLLWSCGGSDGSPVNQPPSLPNLMSPQNNALCIDNSVAFEWSPVTDPEGDLVKYQLQVATDAAFSQIVQTKDNLSVNNTPVYLDKGVFYYWRVKAFDINGNETAYTAAYQFFTQGDPDINHLPFSPELVSPSLGAVEQNATTTLEWNASDVDGDSLSYDVYVDTEDPPATKVAENQSEKTHTLDLTTTTNYYWRVVVKDGNGGETQGQVWHFVTD